VGPVFAQAPWPHVAAGLTLGTYGVGLQAEANANRYVALRTGFSFLQVGIGEKNLADVTYAMKPRVQDIPLVLDVHPTAGAFRLSGGVVFNQNRLGLQAVRDGSVFIGDHEYGPAEIQRIEGRIRGRAAAPYVGLGVDGAATRRGRVGFTFELGVLFHGRPKSTLEGTTTLTGAARNQFLADLALENAEIQAEIDDRTEAINYFPVLNFGFTYRLR
jgi:hypothetical protein